MDSGIYFTLLRFWGFQFTHDGSMYAIYVDIYHQYTPVMLALIYQHHGSVMGYLEVS